MCLLNSSCLFWEIDCSLMALRSIQSVCVKWFSKEIKWGKGCLHFPNNSHIISSIKSILWESVCVESYFARNTERPRYASEYYLIKSCYCALNVACQVHGNMVDLFINLAIIKLKHTKLACL